MTTDKGGHAGSLFMERHNAVGSDTRGDMETSPVL